MMAAVCEARVRPSEVVGEPLGGRGGLETSAFGQVTVKHGMGHGPRDVGDVLPVSDPQ